MPTLRFRILPAKVLKNNTHIIRLAIAHNGQTRYIITGLYHSVFGTDTGPWPFYLPSGLFRLIEIAFDRAFWCLFKFLVHEVEALHLRVGGEIRIESLDVLFHKSVDGLFRHAL